MPVEIVICYANSDREAATQLERHLMPSIRAGKLVVWHRDKITPGGDAASELQRRMESAAIVVLLASSDLEIERYDDIEMALGQRKSRGARVIPVLLRPIHLDEVRYSALRMLPDGPAISLRKDKDLAWVEVVSGLRKVVEALSPSATATGDLFPASAGSRSQETSVLEAAAPTRAANTHGPLKDHIKILFLAANPTNFMRLQLDEEVREIDRRIRTGTQRDRFQLEQAWAVTASDLSQTLLRHRPVIVHFSGHGSAQGELILLGESGQGVAVPAEALASLFGILAERGIRCVVLNACYSEPQAVAIARYIDCVVGASGEISDKSSYQFAAGFYTGLAEGLSVHHAFALGCAQVDLMGHSGTQEPKLLCRPGVDASSMHFI